MFTVTFETGNAAFDDGGDGRYEASRLLREVADRLVEGDTEGRVRDTNGNKVGTFSMDGPHPDAAAMDAIQAAVNDPGNSGADSLAIIYNVLTDSGREVVDE